MNIFEDKLPKSNKKINLLLGLLIIDNQFLDSEQLLGIISSNDIAISKQEIKPYLLEIQDYLNKTENSDTNFLSGYIANFLKNNFLQLEDLTAAYETTVNYFDAIKDKTPDYYFGCKDAYLLEFALFFLELKNELKAKEIFVKLVDLITDIEFVANKVKIESFEQLMNVYKKVVANVSELKLDSEFKLLTWFKFLDSESYFIKENQKVDIFLQQAINQTIEDDISQKALSYINSLETPCSYINWLNKPQQHIYKALKETLVKETKGIQALKLTSNNKYLIFATEGSQIKIFDLVMKQEIIVLTDFQGVIFSLTVDKSDRYIFSGGSNSAINVWDLNTKELLASLKEHNGSILSLLVTPDNKHLISTSVDRSVKIWRIDPNNLKDNLLSSTTLTHFDAIINTVTVTSDNQYLILGSNDGKIIVWDLINEKEVLNQLAHDYGVMSVALTSDNKYIVSSGEDRNIKIWDLATKTLAATLTGATSSITKIKITSDNQYIIAGSNDKTIHIWNLATGLPITVLTGHSNLVTDIEITLDNKQVFSSSKDGTIKLWDLEYAKASTIQTRQRFKVLSVAITSDGSLGIVGESSGTIQIWQINDKKEIATLNAHQKAINALALTSDNKYLASAGDDFQIKIWDLASLECVATLDDHQDRVLALLVSADDKYLISGSDDKTIKIWDLDSKTLDKTLADRAGVYALMLGQDNRHFASANFSGKLRLWDLVPKRVVKEQRGWFDTKTATTKDSRYQISRHEENSLRVLDVIEEKTLAVFPTISLVTRCAISDNGIIISCDQLGNVYFLKLENILSEANPTNYSFF